MKMAAKCPKKRNNIQYNIENNKRLKSKICHGQVKTEPDETYMYA